MKQSKIYAFALSVCFPFAALSQVNSGSNGSDGAFNPITSTNINMADHPDGIYHFTSVNIPSGVTVTFTPNANNTPVVWLVRSNCTIAGTVSLNGNSSTTQFGADGGPGGFKGGNGIIGNGASPQAGFGPGGGPVSTNTSFGASASYGTKGTGSNESGEIYGNSFLLPLIGGSGGGGAYQSGNHGGNGGAGGAGAILIVVGGELHVTGAIVAEGGSAGTLGFGGAGSGGAIRLVASTISGSGALSTSGGVHYSTTRGGSGRVRIDALEDNFSGPIYGVASRGYQPIIFAPTNQPTLAIISVAGANIAADPTGSTATPDVAISANQQNPVPVVVRCQGVPLNTEIIVEAKPSQGASSRSSAFNNQGTQSSSTAAIMLNMSRGAGILQAKCISGITGTFGAGLNDTQKFRSYAQTGLTADGERFASVEITATLGGSQQLVYITESGKQFPFSAR